MSNVRMLPLGTGGKEASLVILLVHAALHGPQSQREWQQSLVERAVLLREQLVHIC